MVFFEKAGLEGNFVVLSVGHIFIPLLRWLYYLCEHEIPLQTRTAGRFLFAIGLAMRVRFGGGYCVGVGICNGFAW